MQLPLNFCVLEIILTSAFKTSNAILFQTLKSIKIKYLGPCAGKINQDTLKSQHNVKGGIYIYYCYKQEHIDETALKHSAVSVSQLLEHCVHFPQN